jgi:hypothetical protein
MSEAFVELGGLIGYGGLSEAFEKDETPNRRFKESRRRIDWQAFFQMLVDEGMRPAEIAKKTGMQESNIRKVLRGEPALQQWDQAISALGCFALNIGRDKIPLLGDYHPCVKIDD